MKTRQQLSNAEYRVVFGRMLLAVSKNLGILSKVDRAPKDGDFAPYEAAVRSISGYRSIAQKLAPPDGLELVHQRVLRVLRVLASVSQLLVETSQEDPGDVVALQACAGLFAQAATELAHITKLINGIDQSPPLTGQDGPAIVA